VDPRLIEMYQARSGNPFAMPGAEKPLAVKPAVNLPALVRELSADLASRLASGT
jgi:hypothetical protein